MERMMQENCYLTVSSMWCVIHIFRRRDLQPTAYVSHTEASVVCT